MTERDQEDFQIALKNPDQMRRFRPSYDSIENMNLGMIANTNAKVPQNAVLWCLGDWKMKPHRSNERDAYYKRARWLRDQINCREINFIFGNHDDRCIANIFNRCYDEIQINVGDVKITMNHKPLLSWYGQHHGSVMRPNIMLYGHVHSKNDPRESPLKNPEIWAAWDCGVDGHDYFPYSLQDVLEKLNPRLQALENHKKEEGMLDPFRGREAEFTG